MGCAAALLAPLALLALLAVGGVVAEDELSVRWHAPFFSGGGYCSEATTFALALAARGVDVAIEPHGDGFDEAYVAGLDAATARGLRALAGDRARPDVVVCHSEPGAWHVLGGPASARRRLSLSPIAAPRGERASRA